VIDARRAAAAIGAAVVVAALAAARIQAHDGPPFPIVSKQAAGPYEISVWTDPDATDDGSAGGQFWVMLHLKDGSALPANTRALVTIRPLDRTGPVRSARTSPVEGRVGRQFAALLMDHEGRFAVQTAISGARGSAVVDSDVVATYDLRPPPAMVALYVMPFVAVGLLWLKVLRSRRRRVRPVAQKS